MADRLSTPMKFVRFQGAVLFLDLDNLKSLNDTLGHDVADLLLKQAAVRLSTAMGEGVTVGRFGGDEFMIIIDHLSKHAEEAAIEAEQVGKTILATLRQPYTLAGREYNGTASIGVTLFGEPQDTANGVMKRADLAMCQAKVAGRNTLRLFDPVMQAAINARATLEAEMRVGLRRLEFLPYYQPQVDAEGRLTGADTRPRLISPLRSTSAPGSSAIRTFSHRSWR